MDEPLSNLDALLRLQTRTELKRLHGELRRTFVFVTHDQEEAMTLGTRIAVLDAGRLVQFDTPRRIYREPASRFVAEFIGRPAMNTVDGVVEQGVFRAGAFALPVAGRPDGPVVLGIRPEALVLREAPTEDSVAFELDVVELVEPESLLFVKKGHVSMVARVMRDVGERHAGAPVHLELPPPHRHFFAAGTHERLS